MRGSSSSRRSSRSRSRRKSRESRAETGAEAAAARAGAATRAGGFLKTFNFAKIRVFSLVCRRLQIVPVDFTCKQYLQIVHAGLSLDQLYALFKRDDYFTA